MSRLNYISQRAVRTSFEKHLDPLGSNASRGGIVPVFLMLLSQLGEYACEWAYECNLAPIRNDRRVTGVFVSHAPKLRKKSIIATYSLAVVRHSY